MKCSKCNYENQEHSNFCNNCGSKLEISNTTEENSNLQKENNKKKKIPALSWVSFGFLLMQLFCFLCQFSQIINKHIYTHTYTPQYTCCEENDKCDVYEGNCCNY